MIGLPYFEKRRAEAEVVLETVARIATERVGVPSRLSLVPDLDEARRWRILELNIEGFGREGETFDRRALDEVAADPDALLVVLEVEDRIEGFFFGYYEEPGNPIVAGGDFFFDTGMVTASLRGRGLGLLSAAAFLLLIDLLGDVRRVGLAVWSGGAVEQLVALYGRLGFTSAPCRATPHRCLVAEITPERIAHWWEILGAPTRRAGAPDGPPAA